MTPDYDVATFETWRRKAEEDFAAASILAEHGGPAATICFLCQQTAEKYLKGYLLLRSQPPKRIHQLDVLLELVQTWIIQSPLMLNVRREGVLV
jgi:HEPN domain-containing protein